ncbi:hypothetical protein BaOVIS_032530 [Babesia ovis]|uniref:Uncharacterized protein n=1 Tax=Babesia ovis TaxID=5869 RepID=A0A9W5TCN7_BABOV|nr:hypothetical protein BaOVIS_032530 [Babesia ovis]
MDGTVEVCASIAREAMKKDFDDEMYADSDYVNPDDAEFSANFDEDVVCNCSDDASNSAEVVEVGEEDGFVDDDEIAVEEGEDYEPDDVLDEINEDLVEDLDEEPVDEDKEPSKDVAEETAEDTPTDEVDFVEASENIEDTEILTKEADVVDDEGDESASNDESPVDLSGSLLPESKVSKPGVAKTKKLHWEAKPSVPAYVINTASKFKVEDLQKVSITTKGKAAKLAATKIEEMSNRARDATQKLKDSVLQNKLTNQAQRSEVVAAEKARVLAAKKAREQQAERIRLEAAERRRVETLEKQRLQEEFEAKKAALSKARQDALRQSRA